MNLINLIMSSDGFKQYGVGFFVLHEREDNSQIVAGATSLGAC